MLMLNSLVIMLPLKSTKPGADVDNNGGDVNDNYDEWSQLIMITFMMNDRAHHDGDNDDDLMMITTPDPYRRDNNDGDERRSHDNNDDNHHLIDGDDDQKDGDYPMTNIMVTIKWWLW